MTAIPPAAIPTAWATIGPFFPGTFFRPGDNDLTRLAPGAPPSARGAPFWLVGQVRQLGGAAFVNAVLESWQADAAGRHPGTEGADPGFLGWGRACTDAAGHYAFRSILPGGHDDAAGPRAPHVELMVLGPGIMGPLRSCVFLEEFAEANACDPVLAALPAELRSLLMARRDGHGPDGAPRYRFDVLLCGDPAEETPFFAD